MTYQEMGRRALQEEKQQLDAAYRQYLDMNLKLDMSRGKPDSDQLDLSMEILSMTDHIDNTGVDARNYGLVEGLPEARSYFAGLLGAEAEETIVSGNASLQIMYTLVDLGWRIGFKNSPEPWSEEKKVRFICPVPGYDRHFRVTESFGIEMLPVKMLPTGPDMAEVERLAKDPSVKGMWCVPVYSNPDGYVYADDTVRRLAQMETGAPDFRIFWDNAYMVHHLTEKHLACLNLLKECKAAGNADRALMFCSTSKVTFAGAGVCALAASETNIQAALEYMFTMTIGFDKVNQLRHVRFLKKEGIANHMARHAEILRPKFAKVNEVLEEQLGGLGIAEWTNPLGGYFVSFYALPGCAKRIVTLCAQAGVVLTPAGAAYPLGVDPEDAHIRIAPSFPPITELNTALELLCIATRLASVERLLQG